MNRKAPWSAILCAICLGLFGFHVPEVVGQGTGAGMRMVMTNQTARVYWTNSLYFYLLQSSTNLADTNSWGNEACAATSVVLAPSAYLKTQPAWATNYVGNEIAYDLPGTANAKFFRMRAPYYLPLCSFAMFFQGPMEFSGCATLFVNGPVYANGPILVGTSAALTFNGVVATSSNISAPFMDGLSAGWYPPSPASWNTTFLGSPAMATNILPITPLITATNFHVMIDIPPAGSPVTGPGVNPLYYQAQILVLVTNDFGPTTNSTVSIRLQSWINASLPGSDPAPIVLTYTNVVSTSLLPFLSLTNRFYDQREYKTNLVTQIDVGQFASWLATNANVQSKFPSVNNQFPTVLYVADQRNHATNQMTCVRLTNGAQLPGNGGAGFTVVTPNPLYVWGNYNVQIATSAANASASTTNTTNTVPAALYSDAFTVLSPAWADGFSTAFVESRAAADDTVNAVIITGNMPSTDTSATGFSGGVHNFVRLLEDWTGDSLWLNTSLCRLWTSQTATNQFRNPYGFTPPAANPYYNPPTRRYSYDPNLLNPAKIPPAVPLIRDLGAD